MARPRKQPAERRSASVRADLTIAEKSYVQEQAAQAGFSEAEYVRRRALDFAIPARAERAAHAALVSEINRLGNQLAALGNLANQIALYLHTDRALPAGWETLPSEIKALQRLVEQTLEQVLADDGS
jgi:hypothetical protein